MCLILSFILIFSKKFEEKVLNGEKQLNVEKIIIFFHFKNNKSHFSKKKNKNMDLTFFGQIPIVIYHTYEPFNIFLCFTEEDLKKTLNKKGLKYESQNALILTEITRFEQAYYVQIYNNILANGEPVELKLEKNKKLQNSFHNFIKTVIFGYTKIYNDPKTLMIYKMLLGYIYFSMETHVFHDDICINLREVEHDTPVKNPKIIKTDFEQWNIVKDLICRERIYSNNKQTKLLYDPTVNRQIIRHNIALINLLFQVRNLEVIYTSYIHWSRKIDLLVYDFHTYLTSRFQNNQQNTPLSIENYLNSRISKDFPKAVENIINFLSL